MKSNLVVIVYPTEEQAGHVLETLSSLQKDYLIDLEDAAYVVKNKKGKVNLHQSANLSSEGAIGGSMWGLLIGMLFFAPLAGMAIGAASGALAGKISDYGIDDDFIRRLSDNLTNGTSAIFILVRSATVDKVVPEISKYGGKILQTSLPEESERKLKEAFHQQEAVMLST